MSYGRVVHDSIRQGPARRRLRSSDQAREYANRVRAFGEREFPDVPVELVHVAFFYLDGPPKTRADLDVMRALIERLQLSPFWRGDTTEEAA